MSNDKHTPTPWSISPRYPYHICNDFRMVANCETQIDAARIVQCVNACDGIYEPEMFIRVMRGIKVKSSKVTNQGAEVVFDVEKAIEEMNVTAAELESLRAEKAELIEALRSIKDRLQIVMSEPNGIVRETMINNLLIDIP